LTEETDWVGSQLTNQAVPADEHSWIEEYGVTPDTDPAARHPGLLSRPRAACFPGPGPSQPGQRVGQSGSTVHRIQTGSSIEDSAREHHIGQLIAGINHSRDFRDQIQARPGGDCPTHVPGKPDGWVPRAPDPTPTLRIDEISQVRAQLRMACLAEPGPGRPGRLACLPM